MREIYLTGQGDLHLNKSMVNGEGPEFFSGQRPQNNFDKPQGPRRGGGVRGGGRGGRRGGGGASGGRGGQEGVGRQSGNSGGRENTRANQNRDRGEQEALNSLIGLFDAAEKDTIKEAGDRAIEQATEEIEALEEITPERGGGEGQPPIEPPEPPTDTPDEDPDDEEKGLPVNVRDFVENLRRGVETTRKTEYVRGVLRDAGFSEEEINTRPLPELLQDLDQRVGENILPPSQESARIIVNSDMDARTRLILEWHKTDADSGLAWQMIQNGQRPTPEVLREFGISTKEEAAKKTQEKERQIAEFQQMGINAQDAEGLLKLGRTPGQARQMQEKRREDRANSPETLKELEMRASIWWEGPEFTQKRMDLINRIGSDDRVALDAAMAELRLEAEQKAVEMGIPKSEVNSVNQVGVAAKLMDSVNDIDHLRDSLANGILRERLEQIIRAAYLRTKGEDEFRTQEDYYGRRIATAIELGDIDELKRFVHEEVFNPLFTDLDIAARTERGYSPYSSINEILTDAMIQSSEEYGRGKKYALIGTDENGKEVINQANVLRWFRDKMYEFHDSDVDNQVKLFDMIGVIGATHTTSANIWLFTPAMFTDREGKYLEGLRNQIYMELWLFNTSRDVDAIYRRVMGDDEQLPKTLLEVYYRNTFTKEGTLDRILTLPNVDKPGQIDFNDRLSIRNSNQDTGKALRRALLSYIHITDKKMLDKIEDEDGNSPLFNNEAYLDAQTKWEMIKKGTRTIDQLRGDLGEEEFNKRFEAIKKEKRAEFEKKSKTLDYFDANGRLKGWEIKDGKKIDNQKLYMTAFNAFSEGTKDYDLKNETKERIRLFLMEKEGISYEEARYAETFAFSMMRWSLAASKHDESASAYDAASKVTQTGWYRTRSSQENSGAIFGNPYSVGGFDAMGMDFFTGVLEKNGPVVEGIDEKTGEVIKTQLSPRSVLEIIQGGQGEDIDLSELDEIKFGDLVMEKYGTDHVQRIFGLYHAVIENHEYNFDNIVSIDPWGNVVFDVKGSNEFRDGVLKRFRYSYRTWGGIDYSKKIRRRDSQGNIETVSIMEALWGKQVYMDFVNGIDDRAMEDVIDERTGEPVIDKKTGKVVQRRTNELRRKEIEIKNENGVVIERRMQTDGEVFQKYRTEAWKRPMMYMIAAEIYAHRAYKSGYTKYKMAQVEKIFEWLSRMAGQIEADENDLRNTTIDQNKMFFSKGDIDWMREVSDTTTGKLLFEEVKEYLTIGGLEGLAKGGKIFLKSLGIAA